MQSARERRIREHIHAMRQKTILVLGDLMLDEFIWGRVTRISPEAPVPVVHVTRESAYPGGAANVARNLADFGIRTIMCGMAGRDLNGRKLLSLLSAAQIDTGAILLSSAFATIVKTRIIARNQQVVRVDRENQSRLNSAELRKLKSLLERIIKNVDAVIIEDYGKGFVTQPLVDFIIAKAQENRILVTVDPNPTNPLHWRGATLIKPNRSEAFAVARMSDSSTDDQLFLAGERLLQEWQVPYLLITLGEDGMMLFHPPKKPYHSPTRAREVYDVSGAGDTVIAFLTAALAAGIAPEEATDLANHAAGVVVGKLGTATVNDSELVMSFLQDA